MTRRRLLSASSTHVRPHFDDIASHQVGRRLARTHNYHRGCADRTKTCSHTRIERSASAKQAQRYRILVPEGEFEYIVVPSRTCAQGASCHELKPSVTMMMMRHYPSANATVSYSCSPQDEDAVPDYIPHAHWNGDSNAAPSRLAGDRLQ
jgi:hypothetical protein